MRISAILLLGSILVSSVSVRSHAQLVVTEAFHVDPGWEAGGYWELTVNNISASDVYMIAVGNVGADLVVVRYPDLVGVWYPTRVSQDEWDTNEWGRGAGESTTPDTSLYPFATEFPGATQALVYFVLGPNPPLGAGGLLTGLYFNYPLPALRVAGAPAPAAGSNFMIFGDDGEVVARGQTVGAPLGVRSSTWGAIKALYR
jgi:hypothetical protein